MCVNSVKLIFFDNIFYVCNYMGDISFKFVNYKSSKFKSVNEFEGGMFMFYIVILIKYVLK